jgi:hypothetical protein
VQIYDIVIFRSEVGIQRARCQRQTTAAWLPAFVYSKRVNNASDWLHAREATLIDLGGDVSGGVLERRSRLTEAVVYSASAS